MTIRPSSDPAPQAAQVAAWLRARAPEPPPADLVGRIVLTTEGRRPDPAWLARRRGHHLATRTPGPPRTGWYPVVALLVLSGVVAAVVATGGASIDERAVIVVPPAPPTDSSRVMASPSPTRSPSPTQLPLGPIAKSVRYEEFDALGLLVLVPTDAQNTVASDRVTFDRPYSATIRFATVGDRAQGAAFQPPTGTEQRFWAPTSVNALDGLHRIGVRVRSVDSSVVDGEPAVVVTAEEQGPTALVVHRGRLYVIASVGPRANVEPPDRAKNYSYDVLGGSTSSIRSRQPTQISGSSSPIPILWSFDGEEIHTRTRPSRRRQSQGVGRDARRRRSGLQWTIQHVCGRPRGRPGRRRPHVPARRSPAWCWSRDRHRRRAGDEGGA